MSMPVISMPCNPVNMCQAITDLIESIALEETALSHILNAEGEKLQRAIAMEDITLCQLLEVNADVANMVTTINDLENTLKDKLEFISTNLYYPTKEAGCGCSF
ncbi:MAG: hypothetical protein KBG54_07040 [Oscillospiraceae bacterium]|nr:hypothetical protein [Oscillospiraceae bacterium]